MEENRSFFAIFIICEPETQTKNDGLTFLIQAKAKIQNSDNDYGLRYNLMAQ